MFFLLKIIFESLQNGIIFNYFKPITSNTYLKYCSIMNFQSSLVSLLNATSFEAALRSNMLAGGDCCSRAVFIGACLGAKFGIAGIPVDWMEKVDNIQEIVKMAEQIMN